MARRLRDARLRPAPRPLPRAPAPRSALRSRARRGRAPALAARLRRRADARAAARHAAARPLRRLGGPLGRLDGGRPHRRDRRCSPSTSRSRSSRSRSHGSRGSPRGSGSSTASSSRWRSSSRASASTSTRRATSSRTRSSSRQHRMRPCSGSTRSSWTRRSTGASSSSRSSRRPCSSCASRSTRIGAGGARFSAVAWLGLLISFSQSSFAALLVAVFVLAAVVWRWRSLAALALAVAVWGARRDPAEADASLRHHSVSGLNHATHGRASLIANGIKIASAHPAAGRRPRRLRARLLEAHAPGAEAHASHDTPVTVAAEEGAVGFVLYFWLVAALFLTALPADRARTRRPGGPRGAGSPCSRSSSTRSPTTISSRIRPRGG